MKKKLEDEDLSIVLGGIGNTNGCPYFLQDSEKPYVEICNNCFYFGKDKDDNPICRLDVKKK